MDLGLKGKKILVTGGSKGLGLACASEFYREGAIITISSRDLNNLKEAKRKLLEIEDRVGGAAEEDIEIIQADMGSAGDIINLKEKYFQIHDRIDGLLINAGGPPTGSALEFDDEAWLKAINTNYLSTIRLCRQFTPSMIEQNYGRILAITSVSAKEPLENLVLSNSTRLGVIGFLKTLSNEVGKHNILVNALLPGMTLTDRLDSVLEEWAKNNALSKDVIINEKTKTIPMGRFGKPEELASLATYLLSPKNGYITGQSIAVDGGFTHSAL
ncbi:MAG: SDR family oxidoreductase [Promethearchaeota archaeon]